MAVITINGRKLDVPEGQSVLECALEAGIYIPHLCHHPDLSEIGSCRLCVVSVAGVPYPVPACTLKAEDGMVIETENAELAQARTLAMELLLAGHPEDCSTCPKYGNCELQKLTQYLNGAGTRIKRRVRGFAEQKPNPRIILDMNRCVLCGRCVRACRELGGAKVLRYQKKGTETYIGTLHDQLLEDAGCLSCMACTAVCPTAAIREKPGNETAGIGKDLRPQITPPRLWDSFETKGARE